MGIRISAHFFITRYVYSYDHKMSYNLLKRQLTLDQTPNPVNKTIVLLNDKSDIWRSPLVGFPDPQPFLKKDKDTLCSLQWDKADPSTALSGLPKIYPQLRSSPPPHPERCGLCSGTSAHFEWARCGYTAGSSGWKTRQHTKQLMHTNLNDDVWNYNSSQPKGMLMLLAFNVSSARIIHPARPSGAQSELTLVHRWL